MTERPTEITAACGHTNPKRQRGSEFIRPSAARWVVVNLRSGLLFAAACALLAASAPAGALAQEEAADESADAAWIVEGGLTTWYIQEEAADESADAASRTPPVPFDERPYKIKLLFSFANDTRLSPRLRGDVLRRYRSHASAFVGDAWQLDIQDVSASLAASDEASIAGLEADRLGPYLGDPETPFDKVFVIGVSYEGDQFLLASRELDVFFSRWGPLFTGSARETTQIARELIILNARMFSPLARMVAGDAKRVTIVIKGGKLPTLSAAASDAQARYKPSFKFVESAALFRPMRPVQDESGETQAVKPLPWTLYSVERREGSQADCRIISALKNTLPPQSEKLFDPELIMARTAGGKTRLRLVDNENLAPLAALDVEVRETLDGASFPLGTTDPDGRIFIPQNRTGTPLVWAIIRHGRDTLAVLPILPGAGEEPDLALRPDNLRLDIEGRVVAVQEQIVDQVARRTILAGFTDTAGQLKGGVLRKALDTKNWKQAEFLLKALKASPTKEVMTAKLNKVKDELEKRQPRDKWGAKAKRMFEETENIIEIYFNPDEFLDIVETFEDDLKNGAEEAGVTVDLTPSMSDVMAAMNSGETGGTVTSPTIPTADPNKPAGNGSAGGSGATAGSP